MDLSVILAATAEPSWLDTIGSYAWVIFSIGAGLGFVIFVHELGHFLVAKACGVKCEKFYIGFDWFPISRIGPFQIPHSIWKRQIGETVYGIGILPLGGYVKMLGQDDDPRNAAKEADRIKVAADTIADAANEPGVPVPDDSPRAKELAAGTAAEGFTAGTTVEKADRPYVLDPRSYPAKSVPARMAIISAGVIMNAIFAVVLAAIAFKIGVDEVPAVVGAAVPGDPAWIAGLRPGDKILQFGKGGKEYEHLRFDDLRRSVVFNGTDRDLPILVRHPSGETEWFSVRPIRKDGAQFGTLGVAPMDDVRIGLRPDVDKPIAARTEPAIQPKDKVVAVEGLPIASGAELGAALAKQPTGPLKLTIERELPPASGAIAAEKAAVQKLDIVVQSRQQRYLGAIMQMGPIVAVQNGSPAEKAGLKIGDIIEQIDGESVGDPLSLSQRLLAKQGQTAVFAVRRKEGQQQVHLEISIPLTLLPTLTDPDSASSRGPVELKQVGAAYRLGRTIAEVVPGTPAAAAGLQAGDVMKTVEFMAADEKAREAMAPWFGVKPKALRAFSVDDAAHTWSFIHFGMQVVDPATELKVTFARGDETKTVTLKSVECPTLYDESRGLGIYIHIHNHVAQNWGEAFQLGFRETKERLFEVLTVLSQLVTRRLSPTNLSGPAGILQAAGQHADAGIVPLLMFLTLLSANLAIINFLPIPVLDGGHMLFLAAEWIRGKPVDAHLQGVLTLIGLAGLLSLMLFATAMDIGRFLS